MAWTGAWNDRLYGLTRRVARAGLAPQLALGFLAVIVPAALLLGAVTLFSLAALDSVNAQLVQITRSLREAHDLQLLLVQAADRVEEYRLGGDPRQRPQFEHLVAMAERKMASCASDACHAASQRPADMERALRPALLWLEREGREALAGGGRPAGVRTALDDLNGRLGPMLVALADRVAELGDEARSVRVHAHVLGASFTLAIVLLAGVIAVVVARRMTHPVHALIGGIRDVMAGNWDHRVPPGGPSEIRELATSFNAMVEEIQRSHQRLAEANRTLERRVRERTAELRTTEQALAQAEKLGSLGLLAAGVAHELNNPLTSVVMNTNLLLEEVGPESPLHADLRRIDADATRCRRIIEDLHAFARRGELDRVPSPVEEVIEQALWSARVELQARNVHVRVDTPPDMPEVVWDPVRIVQVVSNLALNAGQAMGDGGTLVIRARRDGPQVVVEVEDSGPGIPAADRSRIFDPFFTTKSYGTGLGLSICHGIVARHGGRIELESRTREEVGPAGTTGTVVRVILPVQEEGR